MQKLRIWIWNHGKKVRELNPEARGESQGAEGLVGQVFLKGVARGWPRKDPSLDRWRGRSSESEQAVLGVDEMALQKSPPQAPLGSPSGRRGSHVHLPTATLRMAFCCDPALTMDPFSRLSRLETGSLVHWGHA